MINGFRENMYKHKLCSDSRMGWIGNKKCRPSGCLFCRIADDDPAVEKDVLFRTKDTMVVMNIFPYNTGHLQVSPVRHVESFEELKESEITSLFLMTQKCVKLLKKVLNPDGFNIGMNIGGEVAGASVAHLHIHIVPRFKGDSGFMEAVADTKVMPQTVGQVFKRLKKEVKMLK
jgi:diadenosine tetraphosphate (Ap4A) HIT family hydrolase